MANCRNCGKMLGNLPVLEYKNMPGRAQYFPDADHVKEDKGVDLSLYKCEYCGLIQLSNEPVFYYRDVIRSATVSDEMKEFRKEYFADFITKYELEGKKIVEVGAGAGEFMQMMKDAGGEVYGIEHNSELVSKGCKNGLSIYSGFPGESIDTDERFDAFYIMNFLEHIPDPRTFLYNVSEMLNDDAIGLIEVPNSDMIMDHMMFSEFMLDHLSYFTKDTLCRTLEASGYDVLECKTVWHNYCLCAIVKKRNANGFDAFSIKQREICGQINSFIDGCRNDNKKVAVWGAGHQALAILSVAGIADKIEFVIDSAEFKQNKYTPGSHCLVVSPNKLMDIEIDVIMIMAASYSDEVNRIIRNTYPHIQTVILREDGLEHT